MEIKPWLVPDAIDFLQWILADQYDHEATVLETGSGGSTIWFADKVKSVLSFENKIKYYNQVSAELKKRKIENVKIIYDPQYPKLGIGKHINSTYDIILIDGRGRVGTINEVVKLINLNGYIILDNAEREKYKPGVKLLNALYPERAIFKKDWSTAFWRNTK